MAFVASPQSSDARVKRPTPITNSRRRPKRSASAPIVRVKAERVSVYASTTHCSPVRSVWSSFWMSGSATLTTVMSSSNMNVARQTASRLHHFRSMPGD